MARRVKETFPDVSFDWIIPAPLGRKRFKKRGYNQAELLAHEMEKQLGILCRTDVLHKKRDTPQQSKLSKYQRQKNLDGTFFVKKPSAIRGRTVLLVDDVSTTGATLRECARTLKDAGARRVYCAVFALSLPQKSRQ
jgi:ComF family protein